MKISFGSWAFSFGPFSGHPISFENVVARLSQAGYDGIEICGFPPHVTLQKYPDSQSRKKLAGLLADHHLGISGYLADLSSINPLIDGYRTRYLDLLARNVELCAEIGSPSIRVDSVGAPGSIDERDYKPAFSRLADIWHAAAGIALKAGVRLVWEFEPGFAFNKPSEVLAMHQAVAHPNFSVLFDTCHGYLCGVEGARQHGPKEVLPGGVQEFLQKLEGRIGAIHVIDTDGSLHGDETSTHAPFGSGRIDFQRLTPKLLDIPGIEWWCIDMCFWAGSWELVDSSREFVAGLLRN